MPRKQELPCYGLSVLFSPFREVAPLRSLYEARPRTLVDHQQLAYQCLGFGTRPQARASFMQTSASRQ
jgi:hypothetical protein